MIISAFETIEYDNRLISNILVNPRTYFNRIKSNYNLIKFEVPFNIKPDLLAYNLYGNTNLQWVFFVINDNIIDSFQHWGYNENELYLFTENKYSKYAAPSDVHHHEDEDGRAWYNMSNLIDDPKAWYNTADGSEEILYRGVMVPVSNLEYERNYNEIEHKNIYVIDPARVNAFVTDMLEEVRKSING